MNKKEIELKKYVGRYFKTKNNYNPGATQDIPFNEYFFVTSAKKDFLKAITLEFVDGVIKLNGNQSISTEYLESEITKEEFLDAFNSVINKINFLKMQCS